MGYVLQAVLRCRTCRPDAMEFRKAYTPDAQAQCGQCGAMLTARPSFFRRVRDDARVLDRQQQQLARSLVEAEYP